MNGPDEIRRYSQKRVDILNRISEALSCLAFYDMPELIEEMFAFITDFCIETLKRGIKDIQIDVVERLITRYSNKGDLVFDPFGGLMTVPYCAVKMDRKGRASELNTGYFMDGVKYLEQAERQKGMPTLFDFMDEEVA